MGEAIAKPCLLMAIFERTEEKESRFPRVRLLVLITDDKYVGWKNLIALNVMRLYLNKIRYEMESHNLSHVITV